MWAGKVFKLVVRPLSALSLVVPMLALLGVALLAPSLASAAFTRPFLRQITRAENGAGGVLNTKPCSEAERAAPGSTCFAGPDGVTVDSSGDLWVGDGYSENRLDEFEPAEAGNGFLRTLPIEAFTFPGSLTIEPVSDDFYFSGPNKNDESSSVVEVFDSAGGHVDLKDWEDRKFAEGGSGGGVHVAVYNSTVYVAHGGEDDPPPGGDGLPQGIGSLMRLVNRRILLTLIKNQLVCLM